MTRPASSTVGANTPDRNARKREQFERTVKKWMPWAKRLITIMFLILIPALLYMLVKTLDWQQVKHSLSDYKGSTLAMGAAVALSSYLIYGGFDLLGRYYTRHQLSIKKIMPVAFVAYAFNLNLGSWIGSVALRYRLYSRLGLDMATITGVLTLSLITNWLGYLLLAGTVFSLRLIKLPPSWELGASGLQWIGFGLLAAGFSYLAACIFAQRREWRVRGYKFTLPSARLALLQAGLGIANWSLMALVIFLLLPDKAHYPSTLSILLISSIAGVVTRIPAGLGVLEAVFVALMQHEFSRDVLIAALIGYRAIYFLAPLMIACIVYLILERAAKRPREHR
jgi:uncharacterized membrane protein YbhN (UPF0104 family)